MENQSARRWIAWWTMGLAAAGALGFTLYTHLPQFYAAITRDDPVEAVLGPASQLSLAASLIAAAVVYAVSAAVFRRWFVWQALAFAGVLAATVTAANISTAGWMHFILTIGQGDAVAQSVKTYRDATNTDHAAFTEDMAKLAFPEFTYASALSAPGGLDRARAKIKTAHEIAVKYDQLYTQRTMELENRIHRSKTGRFAKMRGLQRLQQTIAPEIKARRQMWKKRQEIIAEYWVLLDELAAAEDRWRAADNRLYFSSQRLLTAFEKHIEAINKMDGELAAITGTVDAQSTVTDTLIAGRRR